MPFHNIRCAWSAFFDDQGRETDDDAQVDYVVLELLRTEAKFQCPCGYTTSYHYDVTEREVRDLAWGPWRTVFFTNQWDIGPGELGCFPTKWMSKDGKTLYLICSSDDQFTVRKVQLSARP